MVPQCTLIGPHFNLQSLDEAHSFPLRFNRLDLHIANTVCYIFRHSQPWATSDPQGTSLADCLMPDPSQPGNLLQKTGCEWGQLHPLAAGSAVSFRKTRWAHYSNTVWKRSCFRCELSIHQPSIPSGNNEVTSGEKKPTPLKLTGSFLNYNTSKLNSRLKRPNKKNATQHFSETKTSMFLNDKAKWEILRSALK